MKTLSSRLLHKVHQLRKEIFDGLDTVFEVQSQLERKTKFVFNPSIRIDDSTRILNYDGHFVYIEAEGQVHKSELNEEEVIKVIAAIENKHYERS